VAVLDDRRILLYLGRRRLVHRFYVKAICNTRVYAAGFQTFKLGERVNVINRFFKWLFRRKAKKAPVRIVPITPLRVPYGTLPPRVTIASRPKAPPPPPPAPSVRHSHEVVTRHDDDSGDFLAGLAVGALLNSSSSSSSRSDSDDFAGSGGSFAGAGASASWADTNDSSSSSSTPDFSNVDSGSSTSYGD
jgi:uncharacterized membrane protein YgcG